MPPGAEEGNAPPIININLYDERVNYNKYKIFIQKKSGDSKDRPSISVLKIAELINGITKGKSVEDVRKVGRNRIIVVCTNAKTANSLVQSEDLKSKDLIVYIPNFLVSRACIVKNIDSDYTTDKLMTIIDSRQYNIKSILRMNRRVDVDGKPEFIPTNTVKIFFHGQHFPEYIYIWNARFACEPYIPATKQCFKCLRYGHLSKQCRSKEERCLTCGNNGHTKKECTVKTPTCYNCSQEHESTNKGCPERLRQNNINALMATHNISFQEASLEIPSIKNTSSQYTIRTENKFSILHDYENVYPGLVGNAHSQDIPSYTPPPISKSKNLKNKTSYSSVISSQKRRHSSTEREMGDRKKIFNSKNNEEKDNNIKIVAQVHTEPEQSTSTLSSEKTVKNLNVNLNPENPEIQTSKSIDNFDLIEVVPTTDSEPESEKEMETNQLESDKLIEERRIIKNQKPGKQRRNRQI